MCACVCGKLIEREREREREKEREQEGEKKRKRKREREREKKSFGPTSISSHAWSKKVGRSIFY